MNLLCDQVRSSETTLTTVSYVSTIKLAREKGYSVTLIYFWLDNVNLAIERVKLRGREGGHNSQDP